MLRYHGFRVESSFGKKSGKAQMKAADRSGAPLAIVVGDYELELGSVGVRELNTSNQVLVELDNLVDYINIKLENRL